MSLKHRQTFVVCYDLRGYEITKRKDHREDSVNGEKYKTLIAEGAISAVEGISVECLDVLSQDDPTSCYRAVCVSYPSR